MNFIHKLKQFLRQLQTSPAVAPVVVAPQSSAATALEQWADQVAATGVPVHAWLQQRREAGRLYADLPDAAIAMIRARWPDRVAHLCAAAERILAHEFDLLGSGPRVIADPMRPLDAIGYQPIDWAVDPILGRRFPEGFPHKQWNPEMRPGLADIKWPWEIGRCQHWVTLGQAYRLTGDERYAREVVRQHADFMQANPVGIGVQFVCTMDVAIRAFNWALTFELIRSSSSFDQPAMTAAYRSLFDVGVFIEGNLENKYEVTSNHFLSNVVGLAAIGAVFRDLVAGQRWLGQTREWLETEMKVQVLDDGLDYESSVPYHRLVAELFLGAARLADLSGTPLSEFYRGRLRQMIDTHITLLRPDGLMPQIGDADDGRLHIFTDYGSWKPQSGRHLAGPSAAMFNEPEWFAAGGDDGLWEAAWWGFEVAALGDADRLAPVARLLPSAGLAVSRERDTYLLVTNSRVGTNGFGNHKHNDLLSFEFHAGAPVIVDPGSYVYTSDPDARNLFRSTRTHNSLQIDGVEQNDIRLDYLFRMFETSTVEHLAFDDSDAETVYRGLHTGYQRLPEPVTHEREFRLNKRDGSLSLLDRLTGAGTHALSWHFHLAPGVNVIAVGDGRFKLTTAGRTWELRAPGQLAATISPAWYSPSYGVRVPCQALDFTITTDTVSVPDYRFEIGPQPHA